MLFIVQNDIRSQKTHGARPFAQSPSVRLVCLALRADRRLSFFELRLNCVRQLVAELAHGTRNAIELAVQLDNLYVLLVFQIRIHFDALLETVYVLSVATQQLVLVVQGLDEVVRGRGVCIVDFVFEVRNKRIEQLRRGFLAEQRRVEEVLTLDNKIRVGLFDQIIQSIV